MSRIVMRFTGVGGQGVLLAGEIFAAAKIKWVALEFKQQLIHLKLEEVQQLLIFSWIDERNLVSLCYRWTDWLLMPSVADQSYQPF